MPSSCTLAWSSSGSRFSASSSAMFCSVAAFAESISARRSPGLWRGLCPEPKSGEQDRSVFNKVAAGVHNEVMGGVDGGRSDVCPDLLLRLVFELNESAHASAVAHRTVRPVTRPLVIENEGEVKATPV